jgi:hypothetical protein
VRALDRLRDELHCQVCAVHHLGKDASRGSRGHNLLHCAVDTGITIERDKASGIATATLTKQRDGIAGQAVAFRLLPVLLGYDADDEPVTSCVVEPAESAPQTGRTTTARLPPAAAQALEAFGEAIAKAGEAPSACDHITANTQCVTESLWRDYCRARQISGSDKPEARQKCVFRGKSAADSDMKSATDSDLISAIPL